MGKGRKPWAEWGRTIALEVVAREGVVTVSGLAAVFEKRIKDRLHVAPTTFPRTAKNGLIADRLAGQVARLMEKRGDVIVRKNYTGRIDTLIRKPL